MSGVRQVAYINAQLHHERVRRMLGSDGNCCCWCDRQLRKQPRPEQARIAGLSYVTVEHLIPRRYGGPDWLENLMLACETCNFQRADTAAAEFAGRCLAAGSEVHLAALSARFASLIAVLGAADGEGGLLDHARQQSDGLAGLAAQRRAAADAAAAQVQRLRSPSDNVRTRAVGQLPLWAQQAYAHALAAGPPPCDRCPDAGQTVTPVVLRDPPGVYLTALTCSVCQTVRLRSFDEALT